MGLFDGFGPDFAPASNGWGDVAVTPGNVDANNLSLAQKLRLGITGSPDQNKDLASAGQTLGKGMSSLFGNKQQQQPAAAAPAAPTNPHAGSGMDIGRQIALGQSPFVAAPPGASSGPAATTGAAALPPGQKKPTPIYGSPFAAAPTGQT